jgi:hypothetical protein
MLFFEVIEYRLHAFALLPEHLSLSLSLSLSLHLLGYLG